MPLPCRGAADAACFAFGRIRPRCSRDCSSLIPKTDTSSDRRASSRSREGHRHGFDTAKDNAAPDGPAGWGQSRKVRTAKVCPATDGQLAQLVRGQGWRVGPVRQADGGGYHAQWQGALAAGAEDEVDAVGGRGRVAATPAQAAPLSLRSAGELRTLDGDVEDLVGTGVGVYGDGVGVGDEEDPAGGFLPGIVAWMLETEPTTAGLSSASEGATRVWTSGRRPTFRSSPTRYSRTSACAAEHAGCGTFRDSAEQGNGTGRREFTDGGGDRPGLGGAQRLRGRESGEEQQQESGQGRYPSAYLDQ
ncbi:hypothetical protein OHA98_22215 [Streptomyces sp. NBC_00654]|nr:hypothetical protein [Streptomyces sp. NBC_00654]